MKQDDEKLILSLIQDDLINTRLINGLDALGLDAGDYFLHLKETVLDLMGFTPTQRHERFYAQYMDRMLPVNQIHPTENRKKLEALAGDIYRWLREEVGRRQE